MSTPYESSCEQVEIALLRTQPSFQTFQIEPFDTEDNAEKNRIIVKAESRVFGRMGTSPSVPLAWIIPVEVTVKLVTRSASTMDSLIAAVEAANNNLALATLTTALTGTNNDLRFIAVTAGASAVTVAYVNPGGTAAISVAVVGNAVTVNLGVAAGVITSTAAQVLAAVNASVPAAALVTATLKYPDDGTGIVTAMSAQGLVLVSVILSLAAFPGGPEIENTDEGERDSTENTQVRSKTYNFLINENIPS